MKNNIFIYFFLLLIISTISGEIYGDGKNITDVQQLVDQAIESDDIVVFDVANSFLVPTISWIWQDNFLVSKKGVLAGNVMSFLRRLSSYRWVDEKSVHTIQSLIARNILVMYLSPYESDATKLMKFFASHRLPCNPVNVKAFFKYNQSLNGGMIFYDQQEDRIRSLSDLCFLNKNLIKKIFFVTACQTTGKQFLQWCSSSRFSGTLISLEKKEWQFDEQRAEFQYSYWVKNGVAITDQEADRLMQEMIAEERPYEGIVQDGQEQIKEQSDVERFNLDNSDVQLDLYTNKDSYEAHSCSVDIPVFNDDVEIKKADQDDIQQDGQLLKILKSVPNDIKNSLLYQSHYAWLASIAEVVKANNDVSADNVVYPTHSSHPLYSFDQYDAKTILRPLFKAMLDEELSDEIIEKIFLKEIPLKVSKSSMQPNMLSRSFFCKNSVKEDVFKTARYVYNLVKGNLVLVVGQTPAYLMEMAKEISYVADSKDRYFTKFINVPFSGRPDYAVTQCDIEHRFHHIDLLTRERELIFRDVLQKRGFSPQTFMEESLQQLYIIDSSDGPAFACLLNLLEKWFQEVGYSLPTISLINIKNRRVDLRITDDKEYQVPVIYVPMNEHVRFAFDLRLGSNLRLVPHFHAVRWRSGCDELFKHYPTSEAKLMLEDYRHYARKMMQKSKIFTSYTEVQKSS